MTSFLQKLLSTLLRTEIRSVKRWIIKIWITIKERNHGTHYTYYIDAEDFWKWAEKHKDTINWSKYELKSLVPELNG